MSAREIKMIGGKPFVSALIAGRQKMVTVAQAVVIERQAAQAAVDLAEQALRDAAAIHNQLDQAILDRKPTSELRARLSQATEQRRAAIATERQHRDAIEQLHAYVDGITVNLLMSQARSRIDAAVASHPVPTKEQP
ncbi:hypothetical protein [Accumulibacter sp.]|uniref:hypothetical protein n=1 Tax=Accumulibacter sp. TaxID=2053492 RepID=UPI00260ED381|nr:hypothetical protein [Accumulibacter sp.]